MVDADAGAGLQATSGALGQDIYTDEMREMYDKEFEGF